MPEPHTLESFAALPNDAARNAAMARALGWRRTTSLWGEPAWAHPAFPGRCRTDCAYLTGGDGDPFAHWELLAEVWRLLMTAPQTLAWRLGQAPPAGSVWVQRIRKPLDPGLPGETLREQWGRTPHRAACLAAVAAGLVPQEGA